MPDTIPDRGGDRWSQPAVILVATDLTDLDRLMPFAVDHAAETGSRLILLHVLTSGAVMSVDTAGMPAYDPSGALEFASKMLKPWCAMAQRKQVRCDGLVREGQVAQQIASAISQFQADRIFLGTRSRGKLGKLFLGSVAEQVLRSVNLPVITVGPEAHLPVAIGGQKKVVLFATALRETSRPSAALACRIAASQNCPLHLLHVLPPVDELERSGESANLESAALHELRTVALETGAGCGIPIEVHVAHGDPSIEILAQAAEWGASLIVLGATKRSAFENLTQDRTIYRVLAHAHCPVLTLRGDPMHPAESEAEHMCSRH